MNAAHPPGSYPVVVVGSGPGGLQVSYALSRLGVRHAVISADPEPGGMFRSFPLFQRLISWTKPHAPVPRDARVYGWYDWNSLVVDEPAHAAPLWEFMDGSSYFPSRPEMEQALRAFADRAGVAVRYGCAWESTRREEDGFTLVTSDGEYRCNAAVFAVGTTQPWTAPVPGLADAPHYVETRPARAYEGKRVFIVGKRNSGFELADGLLPWASQIILASPRPARLSVLTSSTTGARARYLQPYEDHVLAGGTYVLDAAIERVARTAAGYLVTAKGTTAPHDWSFEVDHVIAATGFATPLRDLPDLGVATFYQGGRLPAQTPYWESTTVPGIYFAGSVTQGAIGLKKYGIASNSAAVHGFRYNAGVLARHLARTRFGGQPTERRLAPGDVVPFLLSEISGAPELWNQQSYLCRLVTADPDRGILDEGILPLADVVDDAAGADGVAVAIETDDTGDLHPAAYVRRGGTVTEHLLAGNPLHDFATAEHRAQLTAALSWLTG